MSYIHIWVRCVVVMGTRAVVLRRVGRRYECYYHHSDGSPSGLGARLIEALRSPLFKSWEDVMGFCGLDRMDRVVEKPEDVYPWVQADLEYVYVVDPEPPRLTIYATSFPRRLPYFIFEVYSSYAMYFPDPGHVVSRMAEVEAYSRMLLRALEQYHRAVKGGE